MKTIQKFLTEAPYRGLRALATEFFDSQWDTISPDALYQGGVSDFMNADYFERHGVEIDGQLVALVHLAGEQLTTTQISYRDGTVETGFRQQGIEGLMTAAPEAVQQALPHFPYILSPFRTITNTVDDVDRVLIISEAGDGSDMHGVINGLIKDTVSVITAVAPASSEVLESIPQHIAETVSLYLRRMTCGRIDYIIDVHTVSTMRFDIAVTALTDCPMTDIIHVDLAGMKFSEELSVTGVAHSVQFAELKNDDDPLISVESGLRDADGQAVILTKLYVPFIRTSVVTIDNHKMRTFKDVVTKFDRDTLDAMTGYAANALCVGAYTKSSAAATDIASGRINRPCSEALWYSEAFPHPVSEEGKLLLVMESTTGGLNTLETQAVIVLELDVD